MLTASRTLLSTTATKPRDTTTGGSEIRSRSTSIWELQASSWNQLSRVLALMRLPLMKRRERSALEAGISSKSTVMHSEQTSCSKATEITKRRSRPKFASLTTQVGQPGSLNMNLKLNKLHFLVSLAPLKRLALTGAPRPLVQALASSPVTPS